MCSAFLIIILRESRSQGQGTAIELPEAHHCYRVRTNTTEEASSEFFHCLFNHAHADKVHRTLGATTGYKQPDKPVPSLPSIPSCHCEACATAISRKRGLQHTTFNVTAAMCADPSESKRRDWRKNELQLITE